jgi:hypothetical protein
LCHSNILHFFNTLSPLASLSLSRVSLAFLPRFAQHFMLIHCTNFVHSFFTTSRKYPYANSTTISQLPAVLFSYDLRQ